MTAEAYCFVQHAASALDGLRLDSSLEYQKYDWKRTTASISEATADPTATQATVETMTADTSATADAAA
jgi:hypothetical protein